MKANKLRSHQVKAIDAIQAALENGQKHIVVEMATGSGKEVVLAKTVELLQKHKTVRVLVITNRTELKKQLEDNLFDKYQEFVLIDKDRVKVTTEQRVLRHTVENSNEYQFIIFDETDITESIYKILNCRDKTVVVFSAKYARSPHKLFTSDNIVFSYSYKDAVKDEIITPAMDFQAFGPAVELFTERLLEQFECVPVQFYSHTQDYSWDLVVEKHEYKIWVECKTYKSQVVSPSAANSLLSNIVFRKTKQNISERDVVLLVVFSKIPSFQKNEIFRRYRIIVWDIENLVFYSKDDPSLLKQLSQITYFPIDYIEGQPFGEKELTEISSKSVEDKILEERIIEAAEKEVDKTTELIQRLNECKPGKKHSGEYEKICEEILRTLFEVNYFNKLRNQYKTKDEHFRMDLIGSLKINQTNEDSMHPFWQMLVQHYNSHFVVFEFKNYSKEIDQNLIYITEKYLFDAALRNVAIIISRKGFSKSAKFAAEGCLKEHGKLILDITNEDLTKMLELRSDQAADYLLDKLEEFLMGISK